MVARVVLNVYDLADTYNSWTYWCGVGVFHSGVEVYGVEYAFGGAFRHQCVDYFAILTVRSRRDWLVFSHRS